MLTKFINVVILVVQKGAMPRMNSLIPLVWSEAIFLYF